VSSLVPKISGFTILRNGVQYGYPFEESWRSILPWVDEFVIAVGESTDQTREIAASLQSEFPDKVVLVDTVWPINDPEQLAGGKILSMQTNIALDACSHDWCLYLQGDEVLHEDDLSLFQSTLSAIHTREDVHGIVFPYIHFYATYQTEQYSRSAYRREVRAIRKSSGARSIGDAQSFRKASGEKLKAVLTEARIFHYGWVKQQDTMRVKTEALDRLYHGSDVAPTADAYKYKRFWGLRSFVGSHPQVMHQRVADAGVLVDLKLAPYVFAWRDVIKVCLDLFERLTGYRPFEYKSYRLIK
jgi:glycosyltransferase involved in cell wall biosynthesis